MRIEDRDEFVDKVAQAVIDYIEERDRIAGMVELVANRVMELQAAKAALAQAGPIETETETEKETDDAGE